MNQWIEKVQDAHKTDTDSDFPGASQIIGAISEKHIWIDERPEVRQLVQNSDGLCAESSIICSLVQIQAFCHYMLNQCCFTTIKPRNEEWAYDLFQSLNATGTPLTAMETFKPTVVNLVNQANQHKGYERSVEKHYFDKIADALEQGKTATQKSKLTDDLLTVFAHAYNGDQVPRRLSKQRLWLNKQYKDCEPNDERTIFVKCISQVATFLKRLNEYNPAKLPFLDGLPTEVAENDRRLATFCLLYLKDANHKMARTILSLFYSRILNDRRNSGADFVDAIKAVAAFFTLWRSAASTSGLDDTYRKILRGDGDSAISVMSWYRDKQGDNLSVANLKACLRSLLKEKVGHQEQWTKSATTHLNYDNVRTVCRFALFITAKDVVADRATKGLMREQQRRELVEKNYWVPVLWQDKDKLLTIEHIAPQQRDSDSEWDPKLYEKENFHRLGNLTLIPANVNTSTSNKNWPAKWIYYRHLKERDETNLKKLRRTAKTHGAVLHKSTLQLYKKHR